MWLAGETPVAASDEGVLLIVPQPGHLTCNTPSGNAISIAHVKHRNWPGGGPLRFGAGTAATAPLP